MHCISPVVSFSAAFVLHIYRRESRLLGEVEEDAGPQAGPDPGAPVETALLRERLKLAPILARKLDKASRSSGSFSSNVRGALYGRSRSLCALGLPMQPAPSRTWKLHGYGAGQGLPAWAPLGWRGTLPHRPCCPTCPLYLQASSTPRSPASSQKVSSGTTSAGQHHMPAPGHGHLHHTYTKVCTV